MNKTFSVIHNKLLKGEIVKCSTEVQESVRGYADALSVILKYPTEKAFTSQFEKSMVAFHTLCELYEKRGVKILI